MADIIQAKPTGGNNIITKANDAINLQSGVTLSKDAYMRLDKESRKALSEGGAEGYKKLLLQRVSDKTTSDYVSKNYMRLGDGQFIDKTIFSKLDPTIQNALIMSGVAGYEKMVKDNYETAIGARAIALNSGELVPESFYESLPLEGKNALQVSITTYLDWAKNESSKTLWDYYTNVAGSYYIKTDVWNSLSDEQKNSITKSLGSITVQTDLRKGAGISSSGINNLSNNLLNIIKTYANNGDLKGLPADLLNEIKNFLNNYNGDINNIVTRNLPPELLAEYRKYLQSGSGSGGKDSQEISNILSKEGNVLVKTGNNEALSYSDFQKLDATEKGEVLKSGVNAIGSTKRKELQIEVQRMINDAESGTLADGTVFTSADGQYEYMVFSDHFGDPTQLLEDGWEKCGDNLYQRKVGTPNQEATSTDNNEVIMSHPAGLPVPDGWERIPGYENLIRLIASVHTPSVELSDAEVTAIDTNLTSQIETIQTQISELDEAINLLMGRDKNDSSYSPNESQLNSIEGLRELYERRAALQEQASVINYYNSAISTGNKPPDNYMAWLAAYTSPEMLPFIKDDGSIDIFKALNSGKVSEKMIKAATNMNNPTFEAIKEIAPFVNSSGGIDVIKAIKSGKVRDTSIIKVMGITPSQYNDFRTISQYTDADNNINIAAMYDSGLSFETVNHLIGMSQKDYDSFSESMAAMKENDPDGYKLYVNKGYTAYEKYFESNNTKLPDGSWMPNTTMTAIQESDPEGYKLLTSKGYDAYQTYFKANNTEVSPNVWVPNDILKSIEANDPDGWKVYQANGWDKYQEYFKSNNTEVSPNVWVPNDILKSIEANDPDGWKVYQADGWDKYQEYFNNTYTKLPDNQYYNTSELNAMKDPTSKSFNPKAYEILTTQGFDAYINIYNETTEWLNSVGAITTDVDGNQSYNLQLALEAESKIPGRKWQENMSVIFGKDYDDAWRLYLATHVTMSPLGTPPVMTDQEYSQIIKPENISQAEYSKMVPFIKTSGIDIEGAINAKVPDSTILKVTGITGAELDEYKWLARYNANGDWGKLGMSIARDPSTLFAIAKDTVIGMIPLVGTAYHWDSMDTGWKIASAAGDLLFFIPVVKGVSTAVKSGESIGEATLKGLVLAGRDTIIAPYNILRHPVQVAKTMFAPIEVLINSKTLPLAATWRGSYSKSMDITKVLAGLTEEQAMSTRKAMEELIRRVTAGEKNVKIPIAGIGTLKYQGSGLTKIMPDWTGTSTPYGEAFKGLGVDVKGEGLFMSPEHYLGLSFQSATGKTPLYVYKGSQLLGVIDDTGHLINNSGKTIGRIAEGTKIIGLDNKTLGILNKDFKVVNNTGGVVGYYKDGAVLTDNAALIGKYYNGQPYTENGKIIGYINEAGEVVDVSGKVIATMAGKERVIGLVPESAKITNGAGQVIGKGKAAPAFAMVYTKGVQELPEWIQKAGSMAEMEKRAWELFKSGKYGNDLYPVFKQYAKWIELEGILPPGTKIIPLVGGNGKPIVMFTRDPAGRKIEIPLMQVVEKDWFDKCLAITKEIQAADIIPKPIPLSTALKTVKNIPSKAVTPLLTWLKNNKQSHVIGSFSETVFTNGKIKANDIDIAVPQPEKVIDELTDIIKTSGKQVRNDGKKVIEVYNDKKGIWEKAIDVDSLDWTKSIGLKTTNIEGVNIQTPASQVSNLLKRMNDNFEGKGYSRFVRYVNALGKDVNIGIGAKPPAFKDIMKLKAYGMYNTVRDIFVKGLTKETMLHINAMAPDLAPQAKALMEKQVKLMREQESYRRAVARLPKGIAVSQTSLKPKENEIEKLSKEIEAEREKIYINLAARAQILAPITRRVAGSSKKDEQLYNEIVNKTAYTPADTRIQARQPDTSRVKTQTDAARGYSIKEIKPAPRITPAEMSPESSRSRIDTDAVRPLRGTRKDLVARTNRVIDTDRTDSSRTSRTVTDRTARAARTDTLLVERRNTRETQKTKKLHQPTRYYEYKTYGPKYVNSNRVTQTKFDKKKVDKKQYGSNGEIAWRQGVWWITLWPKIGGGYMTEYSKEPPQGYKRRKRLPNETFFTRGSENAIPAEIKMQMGIVDVNITPTGKIKLKYKRK